MRGCQLEWIRRSNGEGWASAAWSKPIGARERHQAWRPFESGRWPVEQADVDFAEHSVVEGRKALADRAMGLRAGRRYGRAIAWLACKGGRPLAMADHHQICRQAFGCNAGEELGDRMPREQRGVNEHAAQR
jgi:hypothetical protein